MLHQLVEKHLQKINRPEDRKRLISHKDSEREYAAPHESTTEYNHAYRLSSAWSRPPAVKFTDAEDIQHIFPNGVIGTRNVGMPPLIAQQMQQLRDGSINPEDPTQVQRFQQLVASTTQLFWPLVMGRIISDIKGPEVLDSTNVDYNLSTKHGDFPLSLAESLSREPNGYLAVRDCVDTIGGSRSEADISLLSFNNFSTRITGLEGMDIDWSFLNVMRGGMLPSIMAAYLTSLAGMNYEIVSVKADRTNVGDHFSKVNGASLIPPHGYKESDHSAARNGFVFSSEDRFKDGHHRVHVVYDPMLATGVSSEAAIREYQKEVQCSPEDIWVVSLFTGGYEGLDRLADLGVKTITLAHDQADLTSNGYIQPGLGDAGDKLSGHGITDTRDILTSMAHLTTGNPHLAEVMNKYALKLTASELIPQIKPEYRSEIRN